MFHKQDSQLTIRRAAIVGSGLAGLTAAHQLEAAGVAVTLFEKSRGPGGRMASQRLAEPMGSSVDIGAQFFTIRNPAFREFLLEHANGSCWSPWQARLRYQGADGSWQEMRPAERYVGVPRMSAITRALSDGLDLQANVRIARLDRDGAGCWQLADAGGRVYKSYDAILLTPPPAQTLELLDNSGLARLADDLNIRLSRMQACWTVMVHFPQGAGAGFDGLMPNSRRLSWAANDSSKPGRKDDGEWWVLHGDPDWSDDHAGTDPDHVTGELLDEFLRCSGITAPVGRTRTHRWLYARPRARTGPGHLWSAAGRVAVAGDWLDGGRVEGAFNSADSLVSRLASEGHLPGKTTASS